VSIWHSEDWKLPRYDYKCKKCHRTFEVAHGINDTIESCEECGGEVRRVFHPVGIVFKGSGFYATDSKKPDNKPGKPYSEIGDEMDKPKAAASSGNGDKDKSGGDDKGKGKAAGQSGEKKEEKAAS
jgi:putative FmdB family regulatory protein